MTTYRVYIDGFCFTVDLTDAERDAMNADGIRTEVIA